MAADILARLLPLNLAAGLAVLCVVVLRAPVRHLFGSGLAYALWLAVPLASAAALAPARHESAFAPPGLPIDTVAQFATEWAASPSSGVAVAPMIDAASVLLVLWLAGCLLGLAAVVILHRRSLSTLGRLHPTGDGLLRSEGVWPGPAVVGVVRPRIVVPADFEVRFTANEQAVILTHERIHLARADAVINAIVVLFQCVNWMNPLVHLGARLLRLDQEMACDAAVIERHPDARRAYAQAMLKTQLAPLQSPLGCYWPARGENPLKERFAMLKMKSPSRRRRYLGAATIGVIVAAAGYGAWASKGEVMEVTQDVVEASARPLDIRLAEVKPAPEDRRIAVRPRSVKAAARKTTTTEGPLSEAEASALDAARAALAQTYDEQRVGLAPVSALAASTAKLTELELALGRKPTVADDALRFAQADLQKTQEQVAFGVAPRSEIGRAAERLLKLQLALRQEPTAYPLALEGARRGVAQARDEIAVGLRSKSDMVDVTEQVRRLESLRGPA